MSHNQAPETIGDRIRALKKRLKVTNNVLAAAAGVVPKTPVFWQMRKPPKGKNKVQEPSDENLEGLVAFARERGVYTSVALLRYGAEGVKAEEASPGEVDAILAELDELTAKHDSKRAQGAPESELRRIVDRMNATLKAAYEAGASNPTAIGTIVRASVGHMTSNSEPARKPRKRVAKKQPATKKQAAAGDRRKRP